MYSVGYYREAYSVFRPSTVHKSFETAIDQVSRGRS